MWVATNEDGKQCLHIKELPIRGKDYVQKKGIWVSDGLHSTLYPPIFPSLKWEDEPIKVKLVPEEE